MPTHCPSCKRALYSKHLVHCGYCGVKIPPPTLLIELTFFDGDTVLCRGSVSCGSTEMVEHLSGVGGHEFEITSRFEGPGCPVEVTCRRDGKVLYEAALCVGVHTS